MAAKKTKKKAVKKPAKKVSKVSAIKSAKTVPEKKVKEKKPKEEVPKPVFTSYIKDRRVAYVAVALVIIVLFAWRFSTFSVPDLSQTGTAGNTLQEGTGDAAEVGDTVTVEYTGVLSNGEEFDSGELEFTIGSGEMIEVSS